MMEQERFTSVRGSGVPLTEKRELSPSERVILSCPATLILEDGDGATIRIEAEDNILPLIETIVEDRDGTRSLSIRFTDRVRSVSPTLSIRMNMPLGRITAIAVSGSGQVTAPAMNADKVELKVSGSGSIGVARVDAQRLLVTISGSGTIDLCGAAQDVDATISGSGDLNAERLKTVNADVRISGSGSAAMHCDTRLQARISGSGNLYFTGNPQIESHVTGSGTLVHRTSAG